MRKSLKAQMSLTIALITLITVLLISVLANIFINYKFREYVTVRQTEKKEELVSNLSAQYSVDTAQWNMDFIHIIGMYALYDGYIVRLYDTKGAVVWDAEYHDMSLCNEVMADITRRMQDRYPGIQGEFTAQKFTLEQTGGEVGSVSIGYFGPYFMSENDFDFLNTLNKILIVTGMAALAGAVVIGWIMARKVTKPLTQAVHMTKAISEGRYDIRIEEESKTVELDQLVTAVNQLAEALETQEQLRKQLTADVAHELRTPLTSVGTHLEAMSEGVWEPTSERLENCLSEVNRITSLVKELEHLARTEQENLQLKKESVDLSELVKAVCHNFELDMQKKQITLQLPERPCMLCADKDKMRQVLVNLISNAVKYTEPGGQIQVATTLKEKVVTLRVTDDGPGIPEPEQPFIFERFYRADKSRNRQTGGAGIGLAIVKSIVTAHGGSVIVESVCGKGSQFQITLPAGDQSRP